MSLRRARRLSLDELTPYLLPLPETPRGLVWGEVFGNARPVELEVGFGKGLFILNSAQARPDVNFVGVEIARKYQLFAATRMAKRSLANVRLARADARQFLRDHVPEASCQALHVYFPDPWWKKRHLKRRVFTPEFAEQCERALQPGGALHLATDVQEYFQLMTATLARCTRLSELPTRSAETGCQQAFLTNFDRKFRLEGRAIYQATYEVAAGSLTSTRT
jgi:tRNA (guanine-N7-)-methyltransferase